MSDPVAPWLHARPARNNSPGDLRPRAAAPAWPGQDGIDTLPGGPFARFVTEADGWAALVLWLLDARYLRGLRTAYQMIAVFAPPGDDNDTSAYATSVAAKVGEGDLNLSGAPVLTVLARAIAHYEDAQVPWNDEALAAGVRLGLARWPAYRAARLGHKPVALPTPADTATTTEALNEAELGRLGATDKA